MRNSKTLHVAIVLVFAVIVRVLLIDKVGVWGDQGFYVYNSKLILEGQTPFIDFLGRSPLFIYSYSALRAVTGHTNFLLRSFIVFWWLAASIPVYLTARELRDHTTGIVAMGIYLFSPFALAYGFWANTQSQAAFFAIGAVYLLVRDESLTHFAAAGALLGLSFLARRSVITVLGAVVLFAVYLWYDGRLSLKPVVKRVAALGVAFSVVLGIGYMAVVGFRPELAIALFEVHAVNLIISTGRGGYPMLHHGEIPAVTNQLGQGRIPIFNDVCQMCGSWTARTFAKTLLVSIPGVCVGWMYMRDLTDHYFTKENREYLFGILGMLAVYAAVMAASSGYYLRVGTILTLVLFGVIAYRSPPVPRKILYDRRMVLVLLAIAGLAAGYLYRNRLIHTYYFMDFWPFIAIIAGVVFVASWRRADQPVRTLFAITLVIATVTAAGGAHPVTHIVLDDNEDGWFTMENMDAYHEDLNDRTQPGDVVFTAAPVYVAGTHARMVNDNARIHYLYATFEDDGPAESMYRRVISGFQSGDIQWVVMTANTQNMLEYNESAQNAFESNYCRTQNDSLYQQTGAMLYKYEENASACPRPEVETMFNETP